MYDINIIVLKEIMQNYCRDYCIEVVRKLNVPDNTAIRTYNNKNIYKHMQNKNVLTQTTGKHFNIK